MKNRHILHPFRITAGVAAGIALLWVAGFLLFYADVALSGPDRPNEPTDVVVVLTGGPGRIEQGFELLAQGKAKAMLVTGVHPDVTLPTLLARWDGTPAAKAKLAHHCCLFTEHVAESTEDNAGETLAWLNRNGGAQGVSVRLVTSDYHMPRALLLFSRAMPGTTLAAWPVRSAHALSPGFARAVLIEYSKTFLTWL